MFSRALRLSLWALCAASLACERAKLPGKEAPPSVVVASASATALLEQERELVLAGPDGASPLDAEILLHQKSVRANRGGNDALILLGRAWIRKARVSADPAGYRRAQACAGLVLARTPNHRLALNLEAQVALNDHRFTEAYDTARRVLAQDPEDIEALGTQSDALLELGRYDEAVKSSDQQVELKPFLPSYARSSYLSWLHGNDKQAVESIRLAIESGNDPSDREPRAWAMTQAALIFWHRGDYAGADAGFVRVLSEVPDYPPATLGRGRVAHARGEARDAVAFLERSYAASPLAETAWRLGDARAAAGDASAAEAAYALVEKQGRLHDPRTLGRFYAVKNRKVDDALRLAEAEMKRRPSIYTSDLYAWTLYRAGRFAEASRESDRALRLGTRDAELLYHAGAIRIASGDVVGGKKVVKDALALNPKFDPTGAVEAAKMLE